MTNNFDYEQWMNLNHKKLKEDWLRSLPPEEVPLDDDLPDFENDKYDLFESYCMQNYNDEMGSKREAEDDI